MISARLASMLVAFAMVGATWAATLDEVVKRNQIVMCAQSDALPYSKQGGAPEGFQIELGRALAAGLGVTLKVHFMRLHREPRKGECDVLISVAAQNAPEPDADYRTSTSYMAYHPVLVVSRSSGTLSSLEALAPGRVAVQSGTWAHFRLTERDIPVWVRFRSDGEILRAVESGEAAAGIVSNFAFGWHLKQHPDAPLRVAVEVPLDEDLGFDVAVGLPGADQALLDMVDKVLGNLSDTGTIAATLQRYGIDLKPPTRAPRDGRGSSPTR